MLRLTRRGEVAELRELTADEDLALRRAFGRYGRIEDRTIGAAVVRRHQHSGAGRWFLCDCLGDVPRPPALVPVTEDHIRRHAEAPWPAHDPACDFYRDQAEQRLICGSYARLAPRKPIPLVTRYKGPEHTKAAVTGRSRDRHRGRLATLLMTLLEQAGLTRIGPGQPLPSIADQYRALRTAAREMELEEGVALASFLCTYLPALPELMAKIARTPPERFRRSHRPHGLLVTMAAEAAVGQIRPLRGDPIPVRGEIAIFGERDGHGQDAAGDRRARSPYLAACVVGRAAPEEPVEVLKAYLHPCASPGHLMPVDSNLERQTLALLLSLQDWLGKRRAVRVTIDKPVFDLGWSSAPTLGQETGAAQSDAAALLAKADEAHRASLATLRDLGIKHRPGGDQEARDPCLPDFILWAEADHCIQHRAVIVETMGFADDAYRDRKHRTHGLMSRILDGAPVVEHDFWSPADRPQAQRDRQFWLDARWMVTGPEPAKADGRSG